MAYRTENGTRENAGFWFARVDISVIRDRRLSPRDLQIYCVLCSFAGGESRSWALKIETIAKTAGCSDRAVQRSLKNLARYGVVEREEQFRKEKQTCSLYRLRGSTGDTGDMRVTGDIYDARTGDTDVTGDMYDARTGAMRDTPTVDAGDTRETGKTGSSGCFRAGDAGDMYDTPAGDRFATPYLRDIKSLRDIKTYEKKTKDPPPSPVQRPFPTEGRGRKTAIAHPEGVKGCRAHGPAYTELFEAFWLVYPRKAEKQAAFAAWEALMKTRADPEAVVRAAREYAAGVCREATEPRFVKHASTFLSENRWKDWAYGEERSSKEVNSDDYRLPNGCVDGKTLLRAIYRSRDDLRGRIPAGC